MSSWKIQEGGARLPSPSPTPKRQVPYTAKQRVKDDMSEAQKRGIDQWNLMIDVLKENGLMEEK